MTFDSKNFDRIFRVNVGLEKMLSREFERLEKRRKVTTARMRRLLDNIKDEIKKDKDEKFNWKIEDDLVHKEIATLIRLMDDITNCNKREKEANVLATVMKSQARHVNKRAEKCDVDTDSVTSSCSKGSAESSGASSNNGGSLKGIFWAANETTSVRASSRSGNGTASSVPPAKRLDKSDRFSNNAASIHSAPHTKLPEYLVDSRNSLTEGSANRLSLYDIDGVPCRNKFSNRSPVCEILRNGSDFNDQIASLSAQKINMTSFYDKWANRSDERIISVSQPGGLLTQSQQRPRSSWKIARPSVETGFTSNRNVKSAMSVLPERRAATPGISPQLPFANFLSQNGLKTQRIRPVTAYPHRSQPRAQTTSFSSRPTTAAKGQMFRSQSSLLAGQSNTGGAKRQVHDSGRNIHQREASGVRQTPARRAISSYGRHRAKHRSANRLSATDHESKLLESDYKMQLRMRRQQTENAEVARRVWAFIGRKPLSVSPCPVYTKAH